MIRAVRAWLRDVVRPYEPDVREALARHVRPGMTVADVGANQGYFTLYLARLVGRHGRVIVVEAHPANAALIRRRVRRRGLARRVRVVHAAASDTTGSAALYPGRESNPGEWSLDLEFAARADMTPTDREPVTVPAITLDGELSRVSVIKIDVEGAEARVVAGMPRLLATERPVIVLERHGAAGDRAVQLLVAAGYRIETTNGRALGEGASPFHLVARPS